MSNLSQQKRQRMLECLQKIRDVHRSDDDIIKALGEIESELNAKKYGLVWEQHEEAVDVKMKTHVPVFTEDKECEISVAPGENYNFLLEGDNLHSLRLLEKTHKGKIDIIYIDPPYNTKKKEFVYDDTKIGEDDGYRHSKWLSFMEERLKTAKVILADTGCIFISIDDNEYAQLKILCDEIFGSENCLGVIIQNKMNAKNDSTDIQKNHEYIISYRKKAVYDGGTKVLPTLIRVEKKLRAVYVENGRFYYINDAITTRGEGGTLNARPNLGYTVYYNPTSGEKKALSDYDVDLARTSNEESQVYHHKDELLQKGFYPIIPPKVRGKLGCWTWSLEKFNSESDNIIITGKAPKYAVKKRTFITSEQVTKIDDKMYYASTERSNSRSILDFSTNEGTNTLNEVMGGDVHFNNPKNLEMIKYLISLYSRKNPVVLDFFAGSGTTAQAVIELNNEDGEKRQFILCTNNENGICENITYQRIKTVITGKRQNGTQYSDGLPSNLKYYRTDFVSKDEDDLPEALLNHVAEMIQLEHGIKLDGKEYLMILDDDEADQLASHWNEYSALKALYVSKNVLFTTEQNALFKDVKIHIIPDYYFNFELREVGESW